VPPRFSRPERQHAFALPGRAVSLTDCALGTQNLMPRGGLTKREPLRIQASNGTRNRAFPLAQGGHRPMSKRTQRPRTRFALAALALAVPSIALASSPSPSGATAKREAPDSRVVPAGASLPHPSVAAKGALLLDVLDALTTYQVQEASPFEPNPPGKPPDRPPDNPGHNNPPNPPGKPPDRPPDNPGNGPKDH